MEELHIEFHRREFPDSKEYYDANWLCVTARYETSAAKVEAEGPILGTWDIERFRNECALLYQGETSQASLDPLEPNLKVVFKQSDPLGHLDGIVAISPDHLNQSHRFQFEIDLTYLPAIIAQCDRILAVYPVLHR